MHIQFYTEVYNLSDDDEVDFHGPTFGEDEVDFHGPTFGEDEVDFHGPTFGDDEVDVYFNKLVSLPLSLILR